MLPLGSDTFPADGAELAEALRAGLRPFITLPDERSAVVVEGDGYPAADRLRIDLSGATVAPGGRPPRSAGVGPAQPGPSARRLEIVAHPLRYQEAGLDLDLVAEDVGFQFDRDRDGRPLLVLASARGGRVEVKAARRDVEAMVQAAVRDLAQQKGVEVEKTEFLLTAAGPRSVRLDAKAHVRKRVMIQTIRGVVTVSGRLDIDDALVAKLSGLSCEGEGLIVSLAVALVRDRVQALEGREFPLTAVSLGSVRLRDVRLDVNEELRVTAAFGE